MVNTKTVGAACILACAGVAEAFAPSPALPTRMGSAAVSSRSALSSISMTATDPRTKCSRCHRP
jgi:hypothetical protein